MQLYIILVFLYRHNIIQVYTLLRVFKHETLRNIFTLSIIIKFITPIKLLLFISRGTINDKLDNFVINNYVTKIIIFSKNLIFDNYKELLQIFCIIILLPFILYNINIIYKQLQINRIIKSMISRLASLFTVLMILLHFTIFKIHNIIFQFLTALFI